MPTVCVNDFAWTIEMPVRKYRTIEEMEANTWREPGDLELFSAIRSTWDFAQRTNQPYFPPGVYKHRSIEELWEQEEAWGRANFERYQARRGS
jgi:hypothetical protein